MAKMPKRKRKLSADELRIAPVPFNEALKQVWASPPQHKKAKKKAKPPPLD